MRRKQKKTGSARAKQADPLLPIKQRLMKCPGTQEAQSISPTTGHKTKTTAHPTTRLYLYPKNPVPIPLLHFKLEMLSMQQ